MGLFAGVFAINLDNWVGFGMELFGAQIPFCYGVLGFALSAQTSLLNLIGKKFQKLATRCGTALSPPSFRQV